MNIAIGGIIVFVLILPGMLFRSFVIKSESFENPLDTSFKAEIAIVFLYALFVHGLGIIFLSGFPSKAFDFSEFYLIFLGQTDKVNLLHLNDSFNNFIIYLWAQSIIACFIGFVFRKIVVRNRWDLKYTKSTMTDENNIGFWSLKRTVVPISNEWDNILSGRLFMLEREHEFKEKELNEFQELRKKLSNKTDSGNESQNEANKEGIKNIDEKIKKIIEERRKWPNFAQITALIEVNGVEVIYTGRLAKYYLSSNNSLSKIVLKNTVKVSSSNSLPLDGSEENWFIIPYQSTLNLNVQFLYLNASS